MSDKSKLKAKAAIAAAALAESAARSGDVVALAWEHLRALVDHPEVRYVRLVSGDETWTVRRSRLREVRTAMRPMGQVIAWLDPKGLHLRWHNGRGGLDLRTELVPAYGDTSSFDVTVAGHEVPAEPLALSEPKVAPEPAPKQAEPEPAATTVVQAGPGLAFVVPSGEYTIAFWRAFHAACSR